MVVPQRLLGPRGALDPISPALRCPRAPHPAQLSVGCPAGGDVARGLLPPAGSGCPSSVAPGAQSMAAAVSASPAGGLGDGGASRLWRRAGWGGSGGGTVGARLGAPTIRRGRALGLAACSGAAGAGAVLRGWATGGGGIMGRAGAVRLPGKKARVGWGPLCWGLSLGRGGHSAGRGSGKGLQSDRQTNCPLPSSHTGDPSAHQLLGAFPTLFPS